MADPVIIAVPKGRILEEALPLLARAGIVPEAAFSDEGSRALRFATSRPRTEPIYGDAAAILEWKAGRHRIIDAILARDEALARFEADRSNRRVVLDWLRRQRT